MRDNLVQQYVSAWKLISESGKEIGHQENMGNQLRRKLSATKIK